MMKGLELAERFFEEEVSPVIDRCCPILKERYAAGLISYGSDVLGYDDEMSRDHEWGPRCIIWLYERDYYRYAPALDKAFNQELSKEFLGYPTRFRVDPTINCLILSNSRENSLHHVVITTVSRHLRLQLGLRKLPPEKLDWLCMPEQKLMEFTRGKIFRDPIGEITWARQTLAYFPDDVWRFKLLYAWDSLGWHLDVIGLCIDRGDALSARLALQKTVERIIRLFFLLKRRFCPGTLKWVSREFYNLPPPAGEIGNLLEKCLCMSDLRKSRPVIEEIIQTLVEEYNKLKITSEVALQTPSRYSRGEVSFSLSNITDTLRESLPSTLRSLEIQGACDQWITNEDILIWAKHFVKFKDIYKKKSKEQRRGIGDMMV